MIVPIVFSEPNINDNHDDNNDCEARQLQDLQHQEHRGGILPPGRHPHRLQEEPGQDQGDQGAGGQEEADQEAMEQHTQVEYSKILAGCVYPGRLRESHYCPMFCATL